MRFLSLTVLFWVSVFFAGPSPFGADLVFASQNDPEAVYPPKGLLPRHLIRMDDGVHGSRHVLLADKHDRTLTIWENSGEMPKLVAAYPMDIGKRQGEKMANGDHKTPEGIYFFQERMEGPSLSFSEYGIRAFTMDYPNFFDRIDKKTGNGIWLHAIPDTTSLLRGSRGCVVVRNEIIEKITPLITLKKTPILILDKVDYVSADELTATRAKALDWLDAWKQSWESKQIDAYMDHYSDNFRALRMNKDQWRRYKTGLNDKYSYIRVKIDRPIVLRRKDELIVRFFQTYVSDNLQDFGEKTLFVRDNGNKFEIVTEEWKPLQSDLLAQKNAPPPTTD